MHRFQLYHILSKDKQCAYISKNVPNNYNFFGTVVSRGNGKVIDISRGGLEVVQPGEEELPLNARDQARFDDLGYDVTGKVDPNPKKSTTKTLEAVFCSMEAKELKKADSFKYC
jgi:hypothetical protein